MTTRPHATVLVHTSIQPIRWSDMDALGHVNNTVYFRYMEQARLEWLFAQPGQQGLDDENGGGAVIVNASCTFFEPLVYPGTCEVRMYVGHPGRTSFGSYYEIWTDGRKFAEGAAKIVWVDRTSGRSTPLPEALAARLRAIPADSPAR